MFLREYSPRPRTWAYTVHRMRAVAEHQSKSLLAQLTFLVFALATAYVSLPYMPDDFRTRLGFLAAITLLAGGAAALGAVAYYGPVGVRLGLILEKFPQSQTAVAAGYRMPGKPAFTVPCIVLGEVHPVREYRPDGDYVLDYRIDEMYSPVPEWSVLPAKSLVTGLLVLGSIGSGKTAYVLRPSVFQLFHHAERPGGVVMDSKAALVEPLKAEMAAAGRSADLLPIGPSQPTKWNPLHMPLSDPATVAESLLTVVENIRGKPFGDDSQWIRSGVAFLAAGSIGLLRLLNGYVTAAAVRALLSELLLLTAGSDTPGLDTKHYINKLFSGSSAPSTHPKEFEHAAQLVIDRMGEDEKFRAIYTSELFNLLVPLTAPDVEHLYNAPEDELDMPAWPECIERGLVVVLDCNSRRLPGLAVILGMLLKLSYESAMLSRLDWVRAKLCSGDRHMILCIDEYQDYASPGDADYLALCRESKSMTVFLTQGFASIVQRIGEDRAKVLLQSMRNRLVLNQTVPDFAADVLGQHDVRTVESNISENVTNAHLAANGRFGGDSTVAQSYSIRKNREYVVAPEVLSSLPLGQGILQSHDGSRPVPIHRVYLLPYYAPADTRHADLEPA